MFKVPAAFTLVLLPHTYSLFASGKNFDLANPRATADACIKDTTMDKRVGHKSPDDKLLLSNLPCPLHPQHAVLPNTLLTRHNRSPSASGGLRQL